MENLEEALKNNEVHLEMYKYWCSFGVIKRCMNCGRRLPKKFSPINVDHLLEKSNIKYKIVIKDKRYFFLVCADCHSLRNNGYPGENHKKAIKNAENKFKETKKN